jgi:hypothetical protein
VADEMTGKTIVLPDHAYNPVRINPPEGQMMAVMKGNPEGDLLEIVSSNADWHFRYQETTPDPTLFTGNRVEMWELLPDFDPAGNRIFTPPTKSMPEAEFGIRLVGFGKALHRPHVHYAKWELKPGQTVPELVEKDRTGPFFFFQHQLAIPIVEVETAGNIKVTIHMNLMVRLRNPYRAIFLAGGWESLLSAAVHDQVTGYLRPLRVKNIGQDRVSAELKQRIFRLNSIADGFLAKFGVEVHDTRFVGFDAKGSEKVQEALTRVEVSKLNAEAAVNEAEEIETIGNAKARVDAKRVRQLGKAGAAQVLASENLRDGLIKNTKAEVVAINTPAPIAISRSKKST